MFISDLVITDNLLKDMCYANSVESFYTFKQSCCTNSLFQTIQTIVLLITQYSQQL